MPRKSSKKADVAHDQGELLRMAVALLVCIARERKDTGDQIHVMDAFGVSSPTISKALGVSPISVRTSLHRRRKATRR